MYSLIQIISQIMRLFEQLLPDGRFYTCTQTHMRTQTHTRGAFHEPKDKSNLCTILTRVLYLSSNLAVPRETESLCQCAERRNTINYYYNRWETCQHLLEQHYKANENTGEIRRSPLISFLMISVSTCVYSP